MTHKRVTLNGDWQRKTERCAMNGISFVVRPFRKDEHWPFLEELCERFNLTTRFVAFERSVYFEPQPRSHTPGNLSIPSAPGPIVFH